MTCGHPRCAFRRLTFVAWSHSGWFAMYLYKVFLLDISVLFFSPNPKDCIGKRLNKEFQMCLSFLQQIAVLLGERSQAQSGYIILSLPTDCPPTLPCSINLKNETPSRNPHQTPKQPQLTPFQREAVVGLLSSSLQTSELFPLYEARRPTEELPISCLNS